MADPNLESSIVGTLRVDRPTGADPDALRFAPQEGPQTDFQLSRADIVIFGGGAGGGKSYGLLLEPLRYVTKVPEFNAVIFRRTTPQIINAGGLWDLSRTIYPFSGGVPHLGLHKYDWPNGGTVRL